MFQASGVRELLEAKGSLGGGGGGVRREGLYVRKGEVGLVLITTFINITTFITITFTRQRRRWRRLSPTLSQGHIR